MIAVSGDLSRQSASFIIFCRLFWIWRSMYSVHIFRRMKLRGKIAFCGACQNKGAKTIFWRVFRLAWDLFPECSVNRNFYSFDITRQNMHQVVNSLECILSNQWNNWNWMNRITNFKAARVIATNREKGQVLYHTQVKDCIHRWPQNGRELSPQNDSNGHWRIALQLLLLVVWRCTSRR